MNTRIPFHGVLRRDAESRMWSTAQRSAGRMGLTSVATLALVAILTAQATDARVSRFVVEQRRAFAAGMNFGSVGPYERLDGTAYMEVNPSDPLNAVIVNLDKAPKNARGMVDFSAPFFILKPG